MTDKEYESKLTRIAEVKFLLAAFEEETAPLQDELDELKVNVMDHMQSTKSKRSEPVLGYYVIRSERRAVQIADPTRVSAYIEGVGLNIGEYLKLDDARVKQLAESSLKETGEIIPGVRLISNEYLTIKQETK